MERNEPSDLEARRRNLNVGIGHKSSPQCMLRASTESTSSFFSDNKSAALSFNRARSSVSRLCAQVPCGGTLADGPSRLSDAPERTHVTHAYTALIDRDIVRDELDLLNGDNST